MIVIKGHDFVGEVTRKASKCEVSVMASMVAVELVSILNDLVEIQEQAAIYEKSKGSKNKTAMGYGEIMRDS